MKQIQEALSAPIGAAADFDEDELEAELEELEGAELEEQLLQPATTAHAAPLYVPAGKQTTRGNGIINSFASIWIEIVKIAEPFNHPPW
ncbi:hypothetical protein L1987_17221 [Smallanthus sonchifolius]|uniref:Uncharacterized protein n=1 Tax=Smallanthus sonchifolius TaxID=185202 RepID=A0ACB9IXC6_9ASTR|nr:hypothetical protein L1987_17221 [Smallanthus sonchifolius]